jgi:integrating conjugative element protein (TIGR03761 family)
MNIAAAEQVESKLVASSEGKVDRAEETPGSLRGEVWLTLHTRHAQSVFAGRKASAEKPAIIGLTRFGAILSQLLVCVFADDPYADWWLVKIEAALSVSGEQIEVLRQSIKAKLGSTPAIDVAVAESLHPVRVPLQFRNPYAYTAARLLADFDTLVRTILTARHVGLIDRRESARYLLLGTRAVRRALGHAHGYKYEGTKRQDILDNNAKAESARQRMGEVPADILTGSARARFAPEPRIGAVASVSAATGSNRHRNRSTPLTVESRTAKHSPD